MTLMTYCATGQHLIWCGEADGLCLLLYYSLLVASLILPSLQQSHEVCKPHSMLLLRILILTKQSKNAHPVNGLSSKNNWSPPKFVKESSWVSMEAILVTPWIYIRGNIAEAFTYIAIF